jgi:hypothetical protein
LLVPLPGYGLPFTVHITGAVAPVRVTSKDPVPPEHIGCVTAPTAAVTEQAEGINNGHGVPKERVAAVLSEVVVGEQLEGLT